MNNQTQKIIRFVHGFVSVAVLCFGQLVYGESQDSVPKHVGESFDELAEYARIQNENVTSALVALREQTGTELTSFSLSNAPPTVNGWLPFTFSAFDGITIDLLMSDPIASRGIANSDFQGLISAFNIRVLTSNDDLTWPAEAQAVMTVEKWDDRLEVQIPLLREGSGYVFANPFSTLQALSETVHELDRKHPPSESRMKAQVHLNHLTGFDQVAQQASELTAPAGIPVTYSLYLGDIRLQSSFVWLGRAPEFVALMPIEEFLK